MCKFDRQYIVYRKHYEVLPFISCCSFPKWLSSLEEKFKLENSENAGFELKDQKQPVSINIDCSLSEGAAYSLIAEMSGEQLRYFSKILFQGSYFGDIEKSKSLSAADTFQKLDIKISEISEINDCLIDKVSKTQLQKLNLQMTKSQSPNLKQSTDVISSAEPSKIFMSYSTRLKELRTNISSNKWLQVQGNLQTIGGFIKLLKENSIISDLETDKLAKEYSDIKFSTVHDGMLKCKII